MDKESVRVEVEAAVEALDYPTTKMVLVERVGGVTVAGDLTLRDLLTHLHEKVQFHRPKDVADAAVATWGEYGDLG